jgi:hypothetical protein
LTGTPTAPTAAAGTNTTQVATTAFVSAAVSNLVDAAPAALNTLNELAAALGDDANFSTTVTNAIAAKQDAATAITTSNIGSQTVATAGSCTGNAATATKLATARTIGGVSFDGSANINLPGVNAAGNQSTTGNAATATTASSCSGNAATATTLATARTINGVSFNGSANITVTANTTNTLTRGSYLTGNNFNGSAATTWAVDAATANTASKVVARDASGNFSAGTITATTFKTSDRTLKDNIRNVRGALDKVLQLNGVEFTWIKDGTSSAGVIAQDVEKVLPQAIGRNDDGKKTVQYDALHALLIEAIKELQGQVVDLKSAIKILTA